MKNLAVVFSVFILTVILLADLDRLPASLHRIYDFPNGDKLGHFVLYGLLNLIISLALIRTMPKRSPRSVVLWTMVILAVLIGIEEFSQQFIPARTADWVDLFFSYIGVALGGYLALMTNKKRPV